MTTTKTRAAGASEPDNALQALQATLRALRFRQTSEELPELLDAAAREDWGRLELLTELFRREELRRSQRRFARNLKQSGLSEAYALENFNFELAASRGVEPSVVRDLASCEFVRSARNVILAGSVGTGKTYLARTLGVEALKRDFKVMAFKTADLLDSLYAKRSSFQFGKVYSRIRDVDVLLLDDLAYMKYDAEKVELLFSLIVDRHELAPGSTVVTSNTDVTEWWQYFPSKAMGMAFSDRLLDGAQGIRFSGESIRQSRSARPPKRKVTEEGSPDQEKKDRTEN